MSHLFVAMSGGVDSSVAALLLSQQGYRLSGVNLRMLAALPGETPSGEQDAALAAQRLGIPFHVLDVSQLFRERVIGNFIEEYQQGRTPNPCAVCNRHVKFGWLLQQVLDMGGDGLATGHYARVAQDPNTGRWLLKRGLDASKDQSYFLYNLTQEQLSRVQFPLGELNKTQVREIAQAHGLENAQKRDSQDICFVPDGQYAALIEKLSGQPSLPGQFVDENGQVLGQHQGMIRYTRGQRKGLGVSAPQPLYVLDKHPESNTIRLGPDSALWSDSLTARDFNWIAIPEPSQPVTVTAKTRYTQRQSEATAYPLPDGRVRVTFQEPQRAITPGQAVVLYDGDLVVGGGVICEE